MIAERLAKWPRSVRRIAVVVLPLLLVLAGLGVVTGLISAARSQTVWRTEAHRTLSEGRAAQRSVMTLSSAVKSLPQEAIWQHLYSGADSAARQAAVLADVARVLTQSGIVGSKVIAEPSHEENGLLAWGCRVSFRANAEQLHAVAAQLRALPRYVRLKELIVSAPQLQGPADNPTFAVTIVAEGFGNMSQATAKPSAMS